MTPLPSNQTTARALSSFRRGIALMSVLFALAVVSTLVAGVFWVTVQEQRMGENARRREQSLGAAEVGVAELLRAWDKKVRNNLKVYPAESLLIATTSTPTGTGKYSAKIIRLGPEVYLLDVTGRDNVTDLGLITGSGSRQRIGVLVRTMPVVTFTSAGALATVGKVSIKDAIVVDGNDHNPAGWTDCPNTGAGIPGIMTDASSKAKFNAPAVVTGNPATSNTMSVADTAAITTLFNNMGAQANITLAGGDYKPQPSVTAGGACDTGDTQNWGDALNPAGPCAGYFPIIKINGNVKIDNGVQGQGILLVDGNLHIHGTFTFIGIILVEGKINAKGDAGGEPVLTGTVYSMKNAKFNSQAEDTLEVSGRVLYSRCAVQKAMRSTRSVQLMRSRSWAQLFQ